MNTLEEIVKTLKYNELINTQEDFSGNWASKNKNWLAYTRHKKRDFSFEAAINTLRNVRKRLSHYRVHQQKLGSIVVDTVDGLENAELLLERYLMENFSVMEIR